MILATADIDDVVDVDVDADASRYYTVDAGTKRGKEED